MKEEEKKVLTQVGKVVLTPEAIEKLEFLQEHSNENINHFKDIIAEMINYGIRSYKEVKEFEIIDLLEEFAHLPKLLNSLKKP